MTTTFQYTVRDRAGKLVKGTISAENQTMVMQRLKAGGYAPVSITQANSGMKKELTIPGFGKKVKLKDLVGHGAPVRHDGQLRACRCCVR